MPSSATSPLAALHLLVSMLGEDEIASPDAAFYDRLAETVCRLGSTRRAVVFLTDDVRRRLTAVGTHGVDLDSVRSTPARVLGPARRALQDDVVVCDDAADLTCIPMSAGGRHYGVVVGERGDDGDVTPLSAAEREGLWTLGKVCALAASARAATRQQERARHLGDRLDLARDVHERVVQRLFGVTLALGAPGELTAPQRERCADELQAATEELRTAIQRPVSRATREVETTLREELARLCEEHADVNLTVCWPSDAEVPHALEPLAQTVVCEAVRNARKHARPTTIAVSVERDGDAVAIAVVNDGVGPGAPAGAGVGLRLAAFEALEFGAAVDFGRTPPDQWHVRLMLPIPAPTP
ncbi:sensor histidine kinase [Baekduia sp. Peel2402]|uniref:sensor histidine kinase n=1 Tax=Baekduia sp. Peel2402 TaxID=3458296 RepID=UPI00403E77F6